MKGIGKLAVVFLISLTALLGVDAAAGDTPKPAAVERDVEATAVGRKVLALRVALRGDDDEALLKAVRSLGLDSRYYVMTRGWLSQELSSARSFRGTSVYKTDAVRRVSIDARVKLLERCIRAIDLE